MASAYGAMTLSCKSVQSLFHMWQIFIPSYSNIVSLENKNAFLIMTSNYVLILFSCDLHCTLGLTKNNTSDLLAQGQ